MRELNTTFEGRGETKGFQFRCVSSNDKGYIYEVRTSETSIHYEVFKRMDNTQFNCVSYPSSKAFGLWAWTLRNFDSALKKFSEL